MAFAWARRGVELDAIPDLVKSNKAPPRWRRKTERTHCLRESDLYASPDDKLRNESRRWYRNTLSWEALTLAYAKSNRIADARATLAKWEASLGERKKLVAEIKARREGSTAADKPSSAEDSVVKGLGGRVPVSRGAGRIGASGETKR